MNPIISSELTLFAQEIQRFLSPIVLKEIAKKVGFVQRSSKYQADELIVVFGSAKKSLVHHLRNYVVV
ncbi:hypothetical protein J2S17_002869 [Cytobacillus purgationiresistens]|uniref:Transposase n=2 Tax=Cytobacillus purgationiresistens TaxID=863449 RepID=A0ABU0AIA2_9BACI|nr:hypothetical protein [Cytobacillus purgationiresistens]